MEIPRLLLLRLEVALLVRSPIDQFSLEPQMADAPCATPGPGSGRKGWVPVEGFGPLPRVSLTRFGFYCDPLTFTYRLSSGDKEGMQCGPHCILPEWNLGLCDCRAAQQLLRRFVSVIRRSSRVPSVSCDCFSWTRKQQTHILNCY